MGTVLVIEDDAVLAEGMVKHLAKAGHIADAVGNGTRGLVRLCDERPDVCVVDLMLPEVDGWYLIEQARKAGVTTPIVVVSARSSEHDRVHAFGVGADDYMVKPFSMREFIVRVGAAMRRTTPPSDELDGAAPIEVEELRLDPSNVQAYVNGASARLTPTEFRLAYTLASHSGRVLTRDELMQRVWGRRPFHRDRTVDVCIRNVRNKIEKRSGRHTFFQTRYGVGYNFEAVPK